MNKYTIEITDTFGGDANYCGVKRFTYHYCWVKRFTYQAKTMRGAIQKLAREHGGGWRFEYGDSESARYNLSGSAICLFINWSE